MLSGFGERDARPRVTWVRYVVFERCPASALACTVPVSLGDASGSFSLVMTYMNVSFVVVSSYLFGRVGFGGKRIDRHGLVEWGVRRPPLVPVYGMCGEYRVSGASFVRVV